MIFTDYLKNYFVKKINPHFFLDLDFTIASKS